MGRGREYNEGVGEAGVIMPLEEAGGAVVVGAVPLGPEAAVAENDLTINCFGMVVFNDFSTRGQLTSSAMAERAMFLSVMSFLASMTT